MSLIRERVSSGRPAMIGLGSSVRHSLGRVGSVVNLGWRCLRQARHLRPSQLWLLGGMIRDQVRFTALDGLFLVSLTAFLLGGVILLQVMSALAGLVSEAYLSRLVALLVVREIGPLLVGVLVISRSGTAIAAEMAASKLDREVDTLYAVGVDPIAYLLLPRIVGGIVSVFTLLVLFDAVALLGGFLVASTGIPFSFRLYLGALESAVGPTELVETFLKAVAFGAAIPLVCAHDGLRARTSPTEIPQAVTRAAVDSVFTVFLLSAVISLVCHG
jgi:phospholipid/cholesterol/gamma-HCH transport system permease protein